MFSWRSSLASLFPLPIGEYLPISGCGFINDPRREV
jgi:hypothetical protein